MDQGKHLESHSTTEKLSPEHLFLTILVNLSIVSVGLECLIKFDWFDRVWKSNLIKLSCKFLVLLRSITKLNGTQSFD